jgi:hypothetical protein
MVDKMDRLLQNSLEDILAEPMNVSITKGSVSGNSIEVLFIREQSFESFLYQGNVSARDKDLIELVKKIKERHEQ